MRIVGKLVKKKTKGGVSFIAVDVDAEDLNSYLSELEEYLGGYLYEKIRQNKIKRDGDGFHVTVIAPHQLEKFDGKLDDRDHEIDLIGLGSINKEAFYIVAKSKSLDSYRAELGLGKWDYHITLGFIRRDIHGVPKDETTLLRRNA